MLIKHNIVQGPARIFPAGPCTYMACTPFRTIRHKIFGDSVENFPNYSGYGQTPTVCANHPDRVSYARCGRCNRAICGECQMNQGAGTVCPDCYRELTGGSSKGSKARGSFLARHWHITYTLILINVAAYGLQQIIPNEWMINHGMMWWPYVQHGEYYRLISYGFLHMQHDPMHLVWNMIYLFIFGVSLERMMGRWKFLVVYLGSIRRARAVSFNERGGRLRRRVRPLRCHNRDPAS